MKRKILSALLKWKDMETGRLPLLLYGARQVGKTYMMKMLGMAYFRNTLYVNFEADGEIGDLFQVDIHANTIIGILERYYHIELIPQETLIIFDEIQMCERALESLKYFAEEAPEYYIIAAGSLLGVALNREKYSFPVGKVQMLTMYPMDFEEYLWAKGKELLADTIREHFRKNKQMQEMLHNEALQEYQNYCIIGGMPAVVLADISDNPTIRSDEMRKMILDSYVADMAKYAQSGETVKIYAAYDSLPVQLAKDNKKFQYKLIKQGGRASQYGDAIDWLIKAGIVHKCTKCSQGYLPSAAYQDLTAFKLYYSDMGMLSARTDMTLQRFCSSESEHFRGIFAENYVACALKSLGYELFYWESDGISEIDFLITIGEHVIPVECKAGNHVKAKSLLVYREKYKPEYAIRISGRNFGMADGIRAVPLYAVFCIGEEQEGE
ncbi:MAG: AAA family ATPase [Roseburia sp.]|nr:AAA family ATPase [Roseburia sp.]MCM1242642.1 AAA family ATPase [Roseburia sp.]